eukprot:m.16634 g.16634  ORF g.16634 m.16634 type:complete len:689 (+) comp27049_c0_seq1:191-2257(+)
MKSFREQTSQMASWFAQWNLSEQTVALYALLCRVSAEQARFLSLVLENNLKTKSDARVDMDTIERQANDPDYISGLAQASHDGPLASQLIPRLLLLQPGNVEARNAYLRVLPTVLLNTSKTPSGNARHYEDCRQLLSLTMVHPAFPIHEKQAVRGWLAQLEEQASSETNWVQPPPLPPKNDSVEIGAIGPPNQRRHSPFRQESTGTDPAMGPINQVFPVMNGHRQPFIVGMPSPTSYDRRSRSLMTNVERVGGDPGFDHVVNGDNGDCQGSGVRQSRSQSFPMSSTMYGIGSAGPLEAGRQSVWSNGRGKVLHGFDKPGMRDIPLWLKSLRLHKYQELFADVSYDQMMVLTEDELEEKKITKGARHKIVGSIQKLRERGNQLAAMEEDVLKPGRLPQIIQDLKAIIITPIKPCEAQEIPILHSHSDGQLNMQKQQKNEDTGQSQSSSFDAESIPLCEKNATEEHLTSKFVRVLKKVSMQFLQNGVEDEMLTTFLSILDKTLTNEAFSVDLKKVVFSLKDQCQKEPRRFYRRVNDMKMGLPQRSYSGSGHSLHTAMMQTQVMSSQAKSATLPLSNRQRHIPCLPISGASLMPPGNPVAMSHAMGMGFMPTNVNVPGLGYRTSSMSAVRPSHVDRSGLVRTHSVPSPLQTDKNFPGCDFYAGERDHYMETLCRQVTEHALSDSTERSPAY